MDWTPEAIKAEVDYRQRKLRELAAARQLEDARSAAWHGQPRLRVSRPQPRWWRRLRTWAHARGESRR
ncbi:hypothetical protein [Gandjariella thermophila]|uniref:Uncharacterized protein n=1 Tax=Gandjariella thermophila TaxID=1931992 RepID=A0A4D4JDJ1_9PSEU|nr:hypothetical protein [Gandjariella thermophila]GDY31967.1 hypothetical protein GTS_36000 [Gandjariella thermophila]